MVFVEDSSQREFNVHRTPTPLDRHDPVVHKLTSLRDDFTYLDQLIKTKNDFSALQGGGT